MFARNWFGLFMRELVAIICLIVVGFLKMIEVLHLDWFISTGSIRKKHSKRLTSNLRMLVVIAVLEIIVYKIALIFSGNLIAVGSFCLITFALLLLFLYNVLVSSIIISRIVSRKAKSIFYKHIHIFWITTKSCLYQGYTKKY